MKKMYQIVTTFLCIGLLGIGAGCGPAPQTNKMSDTRFQEKVRVFEADMRAQLQNLEMRLEMLQGSGLRLSDQAKEKWLESSEQFAKTQDNFESNLNRISLQTQENWIAYREDMNRRWAAVEAAFKEFKKAVGKRP
ncbi:hypothetical protein KAR34_13760 [bacterium]|nr:hypothetical protein [bacterium]